MRSPGRWSTICSNTSKQRRVVSRVEYLEALKRTWSDIQEAGLPQELYEAAFNAGLRHYTGAAPVEAATAPVLTESLPPAMAPRMAPAGDATSRLSAETGVDREVLDELLYFDSEGLPGINVGARRLGKNNAERTRTIALVIAGARHFANDEIDVATDQIRDLCKQYGFYDQNNFASYLSDVPGFTFSGPRSNRFLRAKSDAAVKFRQRVFEITGAGNGD